MTLKIGSKSPKPNQLYISKWLFSAMSLQVRSKFIHSFRRYGEKRLFTILWPPVILKTGSRSSKSYYFFCISQWYTYADLVKIHSSIQKTECRQGIFQHSLTSCDLENLGRIHQNLISSFTSPNNLSLLIPLKSIHQEIKSRQTFLTFLDLLWPWKCGQCHQNLIRTFASPKDISVQVKLKSIRPFRRQRADKSFFKILWPLVTLKMGSRSTKSNQFFCIFWWCVCIKFCQNPYNPVGDRVPTRHFLTSWDLENGVNAPRI